MGQRVGFPVLLHLGVGGPWKCLEVSLSLLQERWRYDSWSEWLQQYLIDEFEVGWN